MVYIPKASNNLSSYGWIEFTSSTSWVVPAEIKRVYITLIGAGAGGAGGGGYDGYGTSDGGGGGGAGKVFFRVPLVVLPGSTLGITIGQGGIGGAGATAGVISGSLAADGGSSVIIRNSTLILSAGGGKASSTWKHGGASGSGASEVSNSNGSFGASEQIETVLGGVIYASSSGGASGAYATNLSTGYLPAFRALDPILTAPSGATGGSCGGGAGFLYGGNRGGGGGGGGIGWLLSPGYPSGVSGGNSVSGAGSGGKAPGYGGGGSGGGGSRSTSVGGGSGGSGQPGYCMIEWGL